MRHALPVLSLAAALCLMAGVSGAQEKKETAPAPATSATPATPPAKPAAPAAAPVPAPAPSAPTSSVITLTELKGSVEVRSGADKPWVAATAGMTLGPEWWISTGLRGQAVLKFEDNSVILVQRLTQMKIGEFKRDANTVKTSVDLKYGAVRVKVEKGTAANDFKVSSPTATASVTGTKIEEIRYYRGMGSSIRMGSEGRVQYHVNPTITLGPGEQSDDQLTNPIVYAKVKAWVPLHFTGATGGEVQSSLWHGTPFAGVWDNLRPTSPGNVNQQTQGLEYTPPPTPPLPPQPPQPPQPPPPEPPIMGPPVTAW